MYWYALNVSRMLTDCAEDASAAMCENAKPKFMSRGKGVDRNIHKISVLYGFHWVKVF